MYRIRFAVPEDVPVCVSIAPTTFACSDEQGRHACVRFLQGLLALGRVLCAVVVNELDEPVAFGLLMFITDKLRESLLRNQPRNHFLMGYAVRLWPARTQILTPRAIARAHRGEGLNLLGFYGWRPDLPHESLETVSQLLWLSFPLLHRGYHLKSFLKEVYGKQELRYYKQAGFTVYKTPDQYGPLRSYQPYLVGVERGKVRYPTRAAELFQTQAPFVKLSEQQRRIAQLGYLLRLNNQQIGECLERCVNTIYVHWSRMGRRIGGRQSSSAESYHRAGRQQVIRYVAHCPEVIYPLSIHTLFYHHPALARKYPIPLVEEWLTATVAPQPVEPIYRPDL